MNIPAWQLGCILAALWGAFAGAALWLRRRDHQQAARRGRADLEDGRDAAFCAAHAIDWHATAPEKTP